MHAAGRGYLHAAASVPICGRISAEIMDGIARGEFHLPLQYSVDYFRTKSNAERRCVNLQSRRVVLKLNVMHVIYGT